MLVTLDHDEIQEALAKAVAKKVDGSIEPTDICFSIVDDETGNEVAYRDIHAHVTVED